MLTRIVKLTFNVEDISKFEKIFSQTSSFIQDFKGCNSLELLQDTTNPNIFFTYSQWASEEDLARYRNSDFFKKVWSQTKTMFSAKPEAWSVNKKTPLPKDAISNA
ncbi:putative quinol monooxygenase [Maribacter sp. HTCC2170]|uniref:putative quinol monooxygenase n=1 Tax=Maribacter sp. (strain HTCC2170 / KCCM 42371) TaxID=313603 RepID=UPI00006B48D8|nr:antibiotic biosynthesis monooxygenase family protein [Maribacter sp. HTCC2170]EAR01134.1 Antibiotic biosynthesis monooxygenase domain protein [Maribacter sp. HTCC2170]